MKKFLQKGFSMIELLVVLLIIGILAAIAAPMFLSSADKAKASEAVAGIGSIRSAERIYAMQHGGGFVLPITDGSIYFQGSAGANTSLGVDLRNAKYFSPKAYTVAAAAGADGAALALQFDDAGDGPPEIAFALGRPLVAPLGHRRGGGYWINRHDLVEAVGDVGDGLVAVQSQFRSCAHI